MQRAYPPPSAGELLAYLRGRAAGVKSLRTDAKVDYFEQRGERVKLTMTFVVAAPDRLRVDAESPLGGATVASLATDGRKFQLLDARQSRFLVGDAAPCNLARLLRVHLGAADMVALVLGGAPLSGDAEAVRWSGADGGREVLVLRGRSGEREEIQLAPVGAVGGARPAAWDVVDAAITDGAGKLLYHMSHEEFAPRGALRLPGKSHLEEPARSVDVRIRWSEPELDVAPREGVFQLAPPSGIPVDEVTCD